jgi:hypothetical protein
MFLKGFHLFSDEGRFKERDSGILKGVGCTSVKIASGTGDGFDEILLSVRKARRETFGPMTQQIRHPGRRKILVSPLMMIKGS